MRSRRKSRQHIALLMAALIGFAALPASAQTTAGATSEEWVTKLTGLETAPDIDVAALRQLAEILNYIEAQSPQGAQSVKQRLQAVVQLLADHPSAGRSSGV